MWTVVTAAFDRVVKKNERFVRHLHCSHVYCRVNGSYAIPGRRPTAGRCSHYAAGSSSYILVQKSISFACSVDPQWDLMEIERKQLQKICKNAICPGYQIPLYTRPHRDSCISGETLSLYQTIAQGCSRRGRGSGRLGRANLAGGATETPLNNWNPLGHT